MIIDIKDILLKKDGSFILRGLVATNIKLEADLIATMDWVRQEIESDELPIVYED